ncbi:phosphonate C-P lyase system protein PhnG [Paenibacillus piri]|nr:phosphonate C-P lyase system protein PhnG [Paenibacillus piri]
MSQITRVLIEGDPGLLARLCGQVERSYEVRTVRQPEKSLVMSKARDSVSRQPFFMGEILVTECTVEIGEVYGFGVLMGEDAERAYQLAVVDAALHAKLPITESWTALLFEEEQNIAQRHRKEHNQAMKSKVNFDTMEEYNAKR